MHRKQVVAIFLANIVVSAFVGWLTSTGVGRRSTARPSLAAHEFLLLDEAGRAAAKLGWEDRQPGMRLFDQQGHVRAALFLEPNGVPDLYLYDQNQVARASLDLFDSGVPNLAFGDADQKQMLLTDFDDKDTFNIKFEKIANGRPQVIGSRHLIADESGVHESHVPQERTAH
ncbi:MAG TPA: hypothetical protein VFQ00_03665 [Terriglobales bacterium]|nr:hypothetical protein [Terriglobales bacterium]